MGPASIEEVSIEGFDNSGEILYFAVLYPVSMEGSIDKALWGCLWDGLKLVGGRGGGSLVLQKFLL